MIDDFERLVSVHSRSGKWQVTLRRGPVFSVGDVCADHESAFASAREAFAKDHPQWRKPRAKPSTDLSDLFS